MLLSRRKAAHFETDEKNSLERRLRARSIQIESIEGKIINLENMNESARKHSQSISEKIKVRMNNLIVTMILKLSVLHQNIFSNDRKKMGRLEGP